MCSLAGASGYCPRIVQGYLSSCARDASREHSRADRAGELGAAPAHHPYPGGPALRLAHPTLYLGCQAKPALQLKLQHADQNVVRRMSADGDAETAQHEHRREEQAGDPAKDKAEPDERLGHRADMVSA